MNHITGMGVILLHYSHQQIHTRRNLRAIRKTNGIFHITLCLRDEICIFSNKQIGTKSGISEGSLKMADQNHLGRFQFQKPDLTSKDCDHMDELSLDTEVYKCYF